ncbi:6-phosphogluconolactonase [Amnibacterium flavum]|uniref:6-phosphogluconolactonase n=1 Tax=Amnibacterium flavum TaxID=2173173 RepID=A0A2V1HTN4_9MICO|nr:6-phosphogluconolactonase [Amnibacterium flavum]PVZ94409.1 6-phosphogluconolactonase [Amnibacterium flavum]
MTNARRVLVHPDSDALIGSVAARFITKTIDLLDEFDEINIVLTGGTVGGATQRAVRDSAARDSVDWTRVHFWWGDERFVPAGHPDRNDVQAREALLDALPTPESNIHAFPASDEIPDIDEAAAAYAAELRDAAPHDALYPRFDITFLGVGPDGHIASLFPNRDITNTGAATVIPVLNSPKPPPERLSLTLPVINSSDRIWAALAGADKAPALGLALAGATANEVPVAGVQGRRRTVFFVDQAAAAQVPENLIASTY